MLPSRNNGGVDSGAALKRSEIKAGFDSAADCEENTATSANDAAKKYEKATYRMCHNWSLGDRLRFSCLIAQPNDPLQKVASDASVELDQYANAFCISTDDPRLAK